VRDDPIRILFLTADPSDAARLRLGQELRDVRERLKLAKERDRFVLDSREAVRPKDITQAIFDVQPQIVHFSGHGTGKGELCFEDELGNVQTVSSSALTKVFKLVSDRVNCVLLNACYTDTQAKAISDHISFVIGMSQSLGDKAAIAFSVGFYKALSANYSFEKAYDFGCTEIELEGISEYLTPVLYSQKQKRVRIKWEITLKATLEDLDDKQLEAIVAHIREISGDATLTLQKVEVGSVRLILRGTEEGFNRVEHLLRTGKLDNILGFFVQGLSQLLVTVVSKSERARAWLDHYVKTEAVRLSVTTVWLPASSTVQIFTLVREMTKMMCYGIGKIYKGDNYTLAEATEVADTLDLTVVTNKLAAVAAFKVVPVVGAVLGSQSSVVVRVIREIGTLIITYYEQSEV
jgi:hypothetical protein